MLTDDDKKDVERLWRLKVGKKCDEIVLEKHALIPKDKGMSSQKVYFEFSQNWFEELVGFAVETLLELAKDKSQKQLNDSDFDWIIGHIEEHIDIRIQAEENQIDELFKNDGVVSGRLKEKIREKGGLLKQGKRRDVEIFKRELLFTYEERGKDGFDMDNNVFIVHGHNNEVKKTVVQFVKELGLKAIILDEQPSAGKTIIEKFETFSGNVGYAIVLLTPDDEGRAKGKESLNPRARQNVIFEMGFFIGKIGREKVCTIYSEGVELPSDYHGVVYVSLDSDGDWKKRLFKEMSEIGFKIDMPNVDA